jgi:uncharacterized phage-associated protein
MKVDLDKVAIITAYFADNTEGLYVTKLLKLFYYLDFISYKLRGASVTNDVYFKFQYGPVPSAIKNEIDTLVVENIMGATYKSILSPYVELKRDLINNGSLIVSKGKEYNLRKLSNSEIELVKVIAETFKKTNAKTLSNQTHKEKPWLSTSDRSVIDYGLAEELDISKILPSLASK